MEKKYLFFTLLGLFTIILVVLFFVSKSLSLSPADAKGLAECNSLSFSSKSAVNLVFFSDKESAEKYKNYLLGLSPFDKLGDKFNFYYIDGYTPSCELYKGIALFCYSKDIVKKAASCPNDFIVVLDDKPNSVRSSSYLNVMSINKNSPLSVFAHEFGHALVALDEEYTPATLGSSSQNCKSSCPEFLKNPDACLPGCSLSDYYRSIDQGIMRTLYSNTYGTYDESLILSELEKFSGVAITGKAIDESTDCRDSEYYLLTGNVLNGRFVISNVSKEVGCYGTNGAGNYKYELASSDGTVLYNDDFNPGVLYTDGQNSSQGTIDGETYRDYSRLYLRVPVINEAATITIKENNITIVSVLLNELNSMVCRTK